MKTSNRWMVMTLACSCLGACSAPQLQPLQGLDWNPKEIALKTRSQPTSRPAPQPMFTDAQQPATQEFPLELRALVKLAGDTPLGIQIARAEAQAAEAEESKAFSKWLPTLQPRLSFFRHEGELQDTAGAFLDVDKQNSFGGGAVDLSVDLAEAWYENISSAQRKRAAMLGVQASQQLNVGEAVRLYYDLLQARASYVIAQKEAEYARELVKVEETRVAQGRGLKANVLRAMAFLAAAKGRRARIGARVAGANSRLVALLLLAPDSELLPSARQVLPIRFPEGDMTLKELLDTALRKRPDLQQSKALSEASATDLDQARYAWLFPEMRLSAAYGGFGNTPGKFNDREDYYADVVWKWSFGRVAEARIADAKHQKQLIQTEALRRNIVAELQVAHAQLTAARKTMDAAQQEVAAATSAAELVTERHKGGDALLVEVLDAERAKTMAAISLVRAIGDHNKAQFELRRLTGGGK